MCFGISYAIVDNVLYEEERRVFSNFHGFDILIELERNEHSEGGNQQNQEQRVLNAGKRTLRRWLFAGSSRFSHRFFNCLKHGRSGLLGLLERAWRAIVGLTACGASRGRRLRARRSGTFVTHGMAWQTQPSHAAPFIFSAELCDKQSPVLPPLLTVYIAHAGDDAAARSRPTTRGCFLLA